MVWYTGAIVLLLTNCLYFLMVSSKEQVWNRPVTVPIYPKREANFLAQGRQRPQRPQLGPQYVAPRGNKNQAYVYTEHL